MEFTHEELFQFYSQVRTNENRLSVHVCVCVCVRACARACVSATYMVLVKRATDRGSADGCGMEVC